MSWHVLFPVECCNNSRFLVVVCILLSLDSSVLFFGVGLQDRFVTYPISYTMSTPYKDEKPGAEPDITITNAVPAGAAPTQHDGPPVPPGHARFYCEKCRTVSFLIHLASLLEEGRKLHQLQYGFSPSLVVSPSVCVYICLVFLSFFLSFTLSPTICQKMPPRGDAPVVRPSIRLPLPNVPAASFCKPAPPRVRGGLL